MVAALACAICVLPGAALADAPVTELISVATGGGGADVDTFADAITPEGRFVVFDSCADNIGDGSCQLFVRDRQAGVTELVSASTDGVEGNGPSGGASISDDGRFVAFQSFATNLVVGDSNHAADVFVRDRLLGTTVRASVSSTGEEGSSSSQVPWISGDGRLVSFTSFASNLVSGDANGGSDVFVRDLVNSTTERVSVAPDGG